MKNLPKISIVIVTLNNERTLGECLKRVAWQNYPRQLIDYVGIDGGSTDSTREIFKKYKFRVINSPIKRNAEAQRAVGLREAENNLIVSLDADNYLPSKNWLREMIEPFLDDEKIVHAYTMHYTYRPNDNISNRYFALFGINDPIVYYIGKPDRLSWVDRKWVLGNIIKETKNYYVVELSNDLLPTVGCNGVVYKRDLLLQHAKSDPKEFLHIDVFADLVEKGYNRFAIVKNDVIHDTAATLSMFFKKRTAFLLNYYFDQKRVIARRYFVYNPKKIEDNIKLGLFILYTVTLIKPLWDSLRGFIRKRDVAWFLHPLVCLIFLYAYSMATIKHISTSLIRK